MVVNALVLLSVYFITIPLRNLVYGIVDDENGAPLFFKQIATFLFNYESSLLPFFGTFAGYFVLFYLYCKNVLKQKIQYLVIIRDSLLLSMLGLICSLVSKMSEGIVFVPLQIFIFALSVTLPVFILWQIDNRLFGKTTIITTVQATVKKLGYYILLPILPVIALTVLYFVLYGIFLADQTPSMNLALNKQYLLIAVLSASGTNLLLAVTDIYPKFIEKVLLKRKEYIQLNASTAN